MARFTDGKDDDALRTIGEVSDALGIKVHVLRYWEQQFESLKPLKRSGGRRYYRPDDVAVIETIDRLVNIEGYTLKGARAALAARMEATRGWDKGAGGGGTDGGNASESDRGGTHGNPHVATDRSDYDSGQVSRLRARDAVTKLRAIRKRLAEAIED